MSITKWLTRNEWNASYFAYYFCQATSTESVDSDLEIVLRYGICVLDKVGYKNWTSIKVQNNSNINSISINEKAKHGDKTCLVEGYNGAVLAEIMLDEIDYIERLKETIRWISYKEEINNDFKKAFVYFCECMIEKLIESDENNKNNNENNNDNKSLTVGITSDFETGN